MALKTKPPASNVIGAFSKGLAESPDLNHDYAPNSGYHLPAYTLSLKDLNNLPDGQGIDGIAKEVAWQCVAVSTSTPGEKAVIGEVTSVHKASRPAGHAFDGPVRMTSISHGDIVCSVYKLAKGLHDQKDELVQKYNCAGDHEPRMLRIPGLLATMVWLKAQTPDAKDWVVPLHTRIHELNADTHA